ncbi:chitin deacetylase-like protein [Peziza echinospora]|nr:chitin deacetylase-like protein [Peziza echinospora]
MQFSSLILAGLLGLASTAIAGTIDRRQALNPAAGSIITQCNRPGVVALTFDDGPGPDMSKLVDTLDAAGAKATFFVTGTLYGCIYNRADFVKKADKSGHQIASHTWSHANLANLGASQVQDEVLKLERALVNILGGRKPTYMRPPNLATGGTMQSTLTQLGYRIINVDVDSQDWNNVGPQASFQRIQQAGASGNGHIILMHETVSTTPSQLAPMVIKWAQDNNLKMVTVADCLGDTVLYASATAQGGSTC